jgi:hypothetical protein
MFRAYGSFPNGGSETSSLQNSLRNPLENIQTWGSSPIAPPPTPTPSPSTTSSSPDFHNSQTQPNINNQRQNNIRHLQQSQFQNNLHAHQQQQQKSQPFYIEALNNNNNINNGFKNNDIKGKKITSLLASNYARRLHTISSINFHFSGRKFPSLFSDNFIFA